eukprot:4660629-Amphidinium_carterae.1
MGAPSGVLSERASNHLIRPKSCLGRTALLRMLSRSTFRLFKPVLTCEQLSVEEEMTTCLEMVLSSLVVGRN